MLKNLLDKMNLNQKSKKGKLMTKKALFEEYDKYLKKVDKEMVELNEILILIENNQESYKSSEKQQKEVIIVEWV